MKTLICIAGLPYGAATVTFGSAVAQLEESQVTLLTVIDDPKKESSTKKTLEAAQVISGLPAVEVKIRYGSPVDEIVKESAEGDYGMIVIGEHVARGILDVLLTSITLKVTEKAPSSVLIVKDEPTAIGRILICTGGRQVSQTVVKTGAKLAKMAGASVKLLYVAAPVPAMYTGLDTMDESIEEMMQSKTPMARHMRWAADMLASYEVPTELSLQRGVPANEILNEARAAKCDLLVIGAQVEHTSWLNELLMSTVTPQVVSNSPCSVLVVRSKN